MEVRKTFSEIVKDIQDHYDSTNPIIQQMADYLEKDGPMPTIKSDKRGQLGMVNWFARLVDEKYGDKLLDLYFKDESDAVMIANFMKNSSRHGYMLEGACKRMLDFGVSKTNFYKTMISSMWNSDRVVVEYDSTDKNDLLEDDLLPFGKFMVKEGIEEARVFLEVLLAYDKYGDGKRTYNNLAFFHHYFPSLLEENMQQIVLFEKSKNRKANEGMHRPSNVKRLLKLDGKRYEPTMRPYMQKFLFRYSSFKTEFVVLNSLYEVAPKKYKEPFLKLINRFYDSFTIVLKYPWGQDGLENKLQAMKEKPMCLWDVPGMWVGSNHDSLLKLSFEVLKEIDPKQFEIRLLDFCENTCFLPIEPLVIAIDHFGADRMKVLKLVLKLKSTDERPKFLKALMNGLKGQDWSDSLEDIWTLGAKTSHRFQAIVAAVLAEKPKLVMPKNKAAFAKKKGERLLAFFTLAQMEEKAAKDLLWKQFQIEKDDSVREIILPMVTRIFYGEDFSLKQVEGLIKFAEDRDAYAKGLKGNILDFDNLPSLYFKDGKKLSKKHVQFLIYRMAQIKQMVSDSEAKLLINLLDKEKSNDFAKAILEKFLAEGAVAKQKYIMCLSGLLGDESLLDYLKNLFKELHDNKRLKMAQYVIATIAMIGTDKALRHVEFISRKYKRKASLAAAAVEALENAAEELGLTIFELSDRIIPDFGFDGLYKTIDVGDEEVRVFVGNDFKLKFITEDNKIRKSVPKGASKDVKEELKTIQKEIREVNRAQKEKLEQYMVLERRWTEEDWRKFYLMNPVMFIYASTLVWGVFDEKNQLQQIFYVDEDASLMDLQDDEIELKKGRIGIVHPLRMSETQQKTWQTKFFESETVQPFAQLERKVYHLLATESNAKSIERYNDKEPEKGGRSTQGYFEKRGWYKEVSDGGCFDFGKNFEQDGIYVNLSLYGLCIGYYDEQVVFYNITFWKKGSNTWSGESIPLKEVPEIVFSEIIMDMEGVVKKEEAES